MKKTETDPVTETDLACEALIKRMINSEFPDHDFLGEESYEVNQQSVCSVRCELSTGLLLIVSLNRVHTILPRDPHGFAILWMVQQIFCTGCRGAV